MGVLELIWSACYESGDDYVGTAEDIEHLIGWTGERGTVAKALVECGMPEGHGFLEPADAKVTDVTERNGASVTYRVHDLFQHAPEYAANRRAKEAERRKSKNCRHCGAEYFAADHRSEYCSSSCRQGGWRDRKSKRNGRVTKRNGALRNTLRSETDSYVQPAPAPAPAPSTVTPLVPPADERRTNHPIRNLLGHYQARYEAVFGTKPVIAGERDSGILSTLLRKSDEAKLTAAMDAMFADAWACSQGCGLTLFSSQINRWLAKSSSRPPQVGNGAAVRKESSKSAVAAMRREGLLP